MATPFVAGNWKMNTTVQEAAALATSLRSALDGVQGIEKVLCPPFVSLIAVADAVRGSSLKVGAQNMHFEERGAFTGEVSAPMLRGLCDYVILGHSERRRHFHETDELVNRKLLKALEAEIRPILCVGETLEERNQGRAQAVATDSLAACLEGLASLERLVVAYEPVWAIGTGVAATADEAQEIMGLIRDRLAERFGRGQAEAAPLLYGGSVTAANVQEFVSQRDIDGALVGGASLNVDEFTQIVLTTAQAAS